MDYTEQDYECGTCGKDVTADEMYGDECMDCARCEGCGEWRENCDCEEDEA